MSGLPAGYVRIEFRAVPPGNIHRPTRVFMIRSDGQACREVNILHECLRCGAVVANTRTHDLWHGGVDR